MAEHQSMDPRGDPARLPQGAGSGGFLHCGVHSATTSYVEGLHGLNNGLRPDSPIRISNNNPLDVVDPVDDCDEREQAD